MAALISQEDAKVHLHITDQASNSDLDQKIEQASAIVLDYLTGRIVTPTSLTLSGSTATVTLAHAHGLVSGDVIVSGSDQPEYNGTFQATVASPTTLTFSVTGTPATTATGTLRVRVRETWTPDTVPGHVRSAVLLWLTHLYENRGDDMTKDEALWAATRRLLERSRTPAVA